MAGRHYEKVWEMGTVGTLETVTEHVKRVRRKLETADGRGRYVATVWDVGYKWDPRPA